MAPPPVVEAPPLPAPPPPAPPACLEAATVIPIIDVTSGDQVIDAATGYKIWLLAGDTSGMVKLGDTCNEPSFVPLGLPATGDGTAAPLVEEDDMLVP